MYSKLTWPDLRAYGKTDAIGRWWPNLAIAEYFKSIRQPSRAYPHSYARAAMTIKFAKWLYERT